MTDPGSASLSAMIRITDSGQTLRHAREGPGADNLERREICSSPFVDTDRTTQDVQPRTRPRRLDVANTLQKC